MSAQTYRDRFPDVRYGMQRKLPKTGEYFSSLFLLPIRENFVFTPLPTAENKRDWWKRQVERQSFIENMNAMVGRNAIVEGDKSKTMRYRVEEAETVSFYREFRAFISEIKGPIDAEHGRLMSENGYYATPWFGKFVARCRINHLSLSDRSFVQDTLNKNSIEFTHWGIYYYFSTREEADFLSLRFTEHRFNIEKSLNQMGRL